MPFILAQIGTLASAFARGDFLGGQHQPLAGEEREVQQAQRVPDRRAQICRPYAKMIPWKLASRPTTATSARPRVPALVPGHTQGSMCLLYKDRYLFSGDHLAWDIIRKRLFSFRAACWYDWDQQIASTEALRGRSFEWVLPGHGPRGKASAEAMQQALEGCIAWMRKAA